MEKLTWLRNTSFGCLAFTFFSVIPWYIEDWDMKYFYLAVASLFLSLFLLIVFLILESKLKLEEKDKQHAGKVADLNDIIGNLTAELEKKNENNLGLKESLTEYNKENRAIIDENSNLRIRLLIALEELSYYKPHTSPKTIAQFESQKKTIEAKAQLMIGGIEYGNKKGQTNENS